MNVFLTGCSGYIGARVATALIAAGHEVTGLVRSDASERQARDGGVVPHRGDLGDLKSLQTGAEGADAVVHAALSLDDDHSDIDIAAVESMLGALAGSDRTLIYTSGCMVYGTTGDAVADEDFPLNAYVEVAWRPLLERRILAAAERRIRSVIIRPGFVYGRGGGFAGRLLDTVTREGVIRFRGDGSSRRSFVHVDDLADLYVLALEKASPGSAYNAAVLPAVTMRELYQAISLDRGRAEPEPPHTQPSVSTFKDAVLVVQQISGGRAESELGWRPSHRSVLERSRR